MMRNSIEKKILKCGDSRVERDRQHKILVVRWLPIGDHFMVVPTITRFKTKPSKNVMTRPSVTASPLDERQDADEELFRFYRPEAYFPYAGGKRRGRQQSLSPRGEPLPKNFISLLNHQTNTPPPSIEGKTIGKLHYLNRKRTQGGHFRRSPLVLKRTVNDDSMGTPLFINITHDRLSGWLGIQFL